MKPEPLQKSAGIGIAPVGGIMQCAGMSEHRHDPEAFARWLEEQENAKTLDRWRKERDAVFRPALKAMPKAVGRAFTTPAWHWFRKDDLRLLNPRLLLWATAAFLALVVVTASFDGHGGTPQGFSPFSGAHTESVRNIKSVLNDPGSFDHVETQLQGDAVYTTFRANNGFGAKVTKTWVTSVHTGEIREMD